MNIKKLDDKEVVFVDQPFTDEERKQFSELLRKKKEKNTTKQRKFTLQVAAANALRVH